MSYTADFKGFFRFNKDITEYLLEDFLEDISDVYSAPFCNISHDENSTVVEINGYVNYSEDEVFPLLKRFNPHLLEAEIEYVGEDHALWRHKKYCKERGFVEETGSVVYDQQYDFEIK